MPQNVNTIKGIRLIIIFVLFLTICSYPLFLNLGKLSVRMWDEARNGINAIEMLENRQFIVLHLDGQPDMWNTKPPFFIWMVALSMKIIGITTFALRLPSVLACLSVMIYCFWFCRKHLNSIWTGFLSGLVLATSVGFIDYHTSRNGDFDTMLSMWMFFYATQFYIYLEHKKRKNLLLFALFLALAILTKGIAGCLLLPGLFIFSLTNKQYRGNFKRKEFYLIPILGLLTGFSYYLIREMLNNGYIAAVIENEITGRYMETNEGHVGTVWYYIDLLSNAHYKYWIYFIPVSFLLIVFRANAVFKRMYVFVFVQAFFYLVITTASHTKLPWYDAPLFPFFALLIALGLTQVAIELYKIVFIKGRYIREGLFIVFCIVVFVVPVKQIRSTSIMGEKETYYPELFYGDFINSVYTIFPYQKNLIVSSDGYNPHLVFYRNVWRKKGYDIKIIPSSSSLKRNDTVLICESSMCPKLTDSLCYDTLLQEDNLKLLMRVINCSEYKNNNGNAFLSKIKEIKNNSVWLAEIEKKAAKNNMTVEKQVMTDALWILKETNAITITVHDSLKRMHNL